MKPMTLAAILSVSACSPAPEQTAERENRTAPETVQAPISPPAPGRPGGLPDDRAPLEEPQGTIDPKSAEAAGQVVQSYGALIEQHRFAEAEQLWGDPARARGVSDELRGYSEAHLQIGKPGNSEGAAGSIYINVPTVLYGKRRDGSEYSRAGDMTLRRVNDVPGSTAEQRRWHIESAAWLEAD